MTLFGFQLWQSAEQDHIRQGQRRIGDELNGIADDLAEFRAGFREGLGLDNKEVQHFDLNVPIEPKATKNKGKR